MRRAARITASRDSVAAARSALIGIGLSIVRRLVELHGGTVSAYSEGGGRGSEFVGVLPVESEPDDSSEEVQVTHEAGAKGGGATGTTGTSGTAGARHGNDGPTASPSGAAAENTARSAPTRVLVVDDNPDIAESTALILRLAGYTVKSVLSGQDAIEVGQAFRPSIVLLDIGMPGLDGYAVARRFRGEPKLKDTVLIAMTGYGTEGDRARTREAGFDRHLVKPVDPVALQQLILDLAPAAR